MFGFKTKVEGFNRLMKILKERFNVEEDLENAKN